MTIDELLAAASGCGRDASACVIADNKRFDRIITDSAMNQKARDLLDYASDSLPE